MMLRTLRIRDLAIIEDLTVEFGPGLNLLTGETGAGKSILIGALSLLSGARSERTLVRAGADRAVVEGALDVNGDAELGEWLRQRGVDLEQGQLLVRRELPIAGNARLFVNSSPTAMSLLRELGERCLELHGQHEHQTLQLPERQLELLDLFGGHAALREQVAAAHAARGRAARELAELQARVGVRAERMDELQRSLREIDAVQPRPGELQALARERLVLRNASQIGELLDDVVARSYEGEAAASFQAAAAARAAEQLALLDPTLVELAERLRAVAVELHDVAASFRDYRERADFDPGRLEALESRRATVERLCRRHATDEAGLLELGRKLQRERDELEHSAEELALAQGALEQLDAAYVSSASELTRARQGAGKRLIPAVLTELQTLALNRALFDLDFPPAEGARGAEQVQFLLAANPGEALAPLSRVASGGELSRIMLALHTVTGGEGRARVLVFDEVDAGIGGAVADAVGARLAALARRRQVLCVTHLPQIAAYADSHFRVSKKIVAGRTRTEITPLQDQERVEELARMLGGRRPTQAARQQAAELLQAAGRLPAATAGRKRA